MKYLLVLVVVLVVLWLARSARRVGSAPARPADKGRAGPEEMVSCSHCGVHLPRREALVTQQGLYCSEAHRAAGPVSR